MFEIAIDKVANRIRQLEEIERDLKSNIDQLEQVYGQIDGLFGGKFNKSVLKSIIEEMQKEKKSISSMRTGLEQIVKSYNDTEKTIQNYNTKSAGNFGNIKNIDMAKIAMALDGLGIKFNNE